MAYGLRVRDASNNITLDITDRLTRIIGSVSISSTGSMSVPEFSQGNGFFFLVETQTGGINRTVDNAPRVTISGNTISWYFSESGQTSRPCRLFYGVY